MKRIIQRNDQVRDRLKIGPVILESLKGKVRVTVYHEGKKRTNIALSAAEALRVSDAMHKVAMDAIDKAAR